MRSLNECLGDGRAIPICYDRETLISSDGETCIQELSKDEVNRVKEERAVKASKQCASDVCQRYNGKPCLGTSIHARTPSYHIHHQFFFDENFMMKCLNASSTSILSSCAGSEYFKLLQGFFQSHYYVYDNGCEGIRNGCTEKHQQDTTCLFHKEKENQDLLQDGWRGKPVSRIPPPVPDYSADRKGFHYCSLKQVLDGDITDMRDVLNKEIMKDATAREVDDFCPRKQLDKMMEQHGEPQLEIHEEKQSDGSVSVSVVDKNNTLSKYMTNLNSFVEVYAGEDLQEAIQAEIKRRYDMKLKATISKNSTANTKAIEKAKAVGDIDWPNLVSSNSLGKLYVSQLHLYLMEKMGISKAECEKKGYTKAKKIEDVKQHFYASLSKSPRKAETVTPQAQTPEPLSGCSISLPPASSLPVNTSLFPSTQKLQPLSVPPWGGAVFNTNYPQLQLLKNTCPIDNYLTIFYVLLSDHNTFYDQLVSCVESYATHLVQIKHLFDQRLYSDGKLLWLSLFPGRFNFNSPALDLWGNEDDLFISRLYPAISSSYSSRCSALACPCPTKDFSSYSISLRYKIAIFI